MQKDPVIKALATKDRGLKINGAVAVFKAERTAKKAEIVKELIEKLKTEL
jgi:hypothetical protein